MKVICNCGERMYFTGDVHPTIDPQRWYACKSKHMKLVYNDPIPDWGNYEVNREFREALRDRKKMDEYTPMPSWKDTV